MAREGLKLLRTGNQEKEITMIDDKSVIALISFWKNCT